MHQSELALFAQDFQRTLEPLRSTLAHALAQLEGATGFARKTELRSALRVWLEELETLLERVRLERATVFVFGPPKAGKSMLLDALAGARVAPVGLAPSYPSLLSVRAAESETTALLAFDGTSSQPTDPAALRLALQRAQVELAASVRAARAAGELFDPARQLPSALRRVERALAAPALAHGALELVECPSVHGPLFPGYAEMWIGAPDQACAGIFVVRAAQLADDTVFDGIEELLERFERPILVLNVEGEARELAASGELVPSAEAQDPARLLAAFEELSSAEALARALRSGRVPVLALDLCAAARARLHGVEEAPAGARARFADLERELAGVLDGHEALRALTQSALRRAQELGDEARELAATPGLEEPARRAAEAERERAALAHRLTALERLRVRERARWEAEPFFDELRARLAAQVLARARVLAQELAAPFARALEDWFAGGTGLQELLQAGLEPRLAAARAELARSAERLLRGELAPKGESAARAARLAEELAEARLELAPLFDACAGALGAGEPATRGGALRVLDVEAIPVRAGLGERLTWRPAAEVRRALFGPPEAPALPLESRTKARRLGAEAREAMRRSATERALAILEEDAHALARELHGALLTRFTAELGAVLAHETASGAAPLCALEARVAEATRLAEALGALAPAAQRGARALEELGERFTPQGELVPVARVASSSSSPGTAGAARLGARAREPVAE